MNLFARFVKDESGATAIEYGLIAALISVGIIAAATTLGTNIGSVFNSIGNSLENALPAAGGGDPAPSNG
jgi:pilus assembly protein Flp/PilA